MEGEATLEELLEDETLHVFIARFGLSVDSLRGMMEAERSRIFGAGGIGCLEGEPVTPPSP